jgi:hypothetical protein
MTLAAEEFIRRFLLHVLPKGLVRIRYYGWMANRCRSERIVQRRALLAAEAPEPIAPTRSCEAPKEVVRSAAEISKQLRFSSPAGYHAFDRTDGVNRTVLKGSILLASHAGRGARIGNVCPQGRRVWQDHGTAHRISPNHAFHSHPKPPHGCIFPIPWPTRKYQNPLRNTYPCLPRPPQTQAAPFKRLYQK